MVAQAVELEVDGTGDLGIGLEEPGTEEAVGAAEDLGSADVCDMGSAFVVDGTG